MCCEILESTQCFHVCSLRGGDLVRWEVRLPGKAIKGGGGVGWSKGKQMRTNMLEFKVMFSYFSVPTDILLPISTLISYIGVYKCLPNTVRQPNNGMWLVYIFLPVLRRRVHRSSIPWLVVHMRRISFYSLFQFVRHTVQCKIISKYAKQSKEILLDSHLLIGQN